jgi:hypothetical protein
MNMPLGSHQYLGENMLALLKELANAPELENMDEHSNGQMVYYDYLGWFMIYYTNTTSKILNSLAIVLSVISIIVFMVCTIVNYEVANKRKFRCSLNVTTFTQLIFLSVYVWIEFTFALLGIIGATILGASFPIGIAQFMDTVGPYAMSWYDNPTLIGPLYWMPFVAIYGFAIHSMAKWREKSVS